MAPLLLPAPHQRQGQPGWRCHWNGDRGGGVLQGQRGLGCGGHTEEVPPTEIVWSSLSGRKSANLDRPAAEAGTDAPASAAHTRHRCGAAFFNLQVHRDRT